MKKTTIKFSLERVILPRFDSRSGSKCHTKGPFEGRKSPVESRRPGAAAAEIKTEASTNFWLIQQAFPEAILRFETEKTLTQAVEWSLNYEGT